MKNDVISNYLAQIFNVLIRFYLIPVYLSKLGTSAFGIISFYFTLESIMVLLDFGLGVASSKVLAERNDQTNKSVSHIIRFAESLYLALSILIGIIIYCSSSFISSEWLKIDDKSINGIEVLSWMALLLTVSWPKSLYENFLIGQKKIVTKNIINICINLIKVLLMIYFLSLENNKILAYLWVMIGCNFLENICLRYFSTKDVYVDFKFATKRNDLKYFFKYATGVGFFSILSLFIFQVDKLFISKNMTTSELGNYNLACVIPMAQFMLIYPITSAIFPRLVNYKKNSSNSFDNIYADWSYLLSIICVSSFTFLTLNFPLILEFWLGKAYRNAHINLIAYEIMIGVLFHALSSINISLFLANEKSKTVIKIYIYSVVIYIISLFVFSNYSILGVAFSWILCNFSIFIFSFISLRNFDYLLFKKYLLLLKQISIFFLIVLLGYFLNEKIFQLQNIYNLIFVCFIIFFSIYIVFYKKLKNIVSTILLTSN
jgi:O-antigen/teichoic acid export membrane protein